MINVFFSPKLTELLRQGKYTVYSPSKDQPELISVFYMSGDLLCYADADKLKEHPDLVAEHLLKVEQLVQDARLPIRLLERIWLVVLPLVSLLYSWNQDWDYWLKWGIVAFFGMISSVTRSAMARIFIKLISLRIRKSLGL